MTWLDIATAAFGEPSIAFPEPVIRPWMNRRCWAWFVDGQNFNLAIDVEHGRVHTSANSPGRHAKLYTDADPTDVDLQFICAYAWPGYAAGRDVVNVA